MMNIQGEVYPDMEGPLVPPGSVEDYGYFSPNSCDQAEPSHGSPTQSPNSSSVHNVGNFNGQIQRLLHDLMNVGSENNTVNGFPSHHALTPHGSTNSMTTQSLTTPIQQSHGNLHGSERVEAQPTLVTGSWTCSRSKAKRYLERFYAHCKRPTTLDIDLITDYLGVNGKVVQTWFYHRRQEDKQLRIMASSSLNVTPPMAVPPETFPGPPAPAFQPLQSTTYPIL